MPKAKRAKRARTVKRVRAIKTARLVKKLKRGPSITGAPPKPSRPQVKRQRMREVAIVTRKEQPFPKKGKITAIRSVTGKVIFAQVVAVPKIEIAAGTGGRVASSWISALEWMGKWVLMTLINGYSYNVYVSRKMYEAWYYAHSKGTFFNYVIKGKYKVVRSA